MFVYMYLSQLMSTFTKLSKGASSSRWFLHSMTRRTSDPTITHMYLYTHVSQIWNTYWISLPCDLLSSLASLQCSLLHHLHLSSDLGLSKYVNQHSHLNLSRNVRLSVLYDLDFNKVCLLFAMVCMSCMKVCLLHKVSQVAHRSACCPPLSLHHV